MATPTPAAPRPPNPAKALLAAVNKDLEILTRKFDDYTEKTDRKINVLRALCDDQKAHIKELESRVAELEELNGIEVWSGGDEAESHRDPSPQTSDNLSAIAAQPKDASTEAAQEPEGAIQADSKQKEPLVKALLNLTMQHHLGVSKLSAQYLPAFPFGMDSSHNLWPKDLHTQQPLLRFNWKQITSEDTRKNIRKMIEHIRATKASLSPAALPYINNMTDAQIEEGFLKRLKYMAQEYNKLAKNKAIQEEQQRRDDELEDELEGDIEDQKTLETSKKNARASAVLKQRIRKRIGSAYEDPKFDSAFIVNAMSDNEDDPTWEKDSGEPKRYLSHAPDWRSNEFTDLLRDIDARQDPEPDKAKSMTKRIVSDMHLNSEPVAARQVKGRVRVWMVKPEVLAAHPHWMGKRVAKNGKAWGDDEDPEDAKSVSKRSIGNNEGGSVRKRRKTVDGSRQASSAAVEHALGGADIDAIFA